MHNPREISLFIKYTLKIIKCLENRVYAVTANRIGEEIRGDDDFVFTGASQITSYDGKILSSAPVDKIHSEFAEIDIEKVRDKKLNNFNDIFEDRRKDFYKV